jgi:hypothetical protein
MSSPPIIVGNLSFGLPIGAHLPPEMDVSFAAAEPTETELESHMTISK